MVESITVILPEVDSAPAYRERTFNRQSILKGPDWRWEKAKSEIQGDKNHIPYVPSTDPYVIIAKRMQYLLSDRCASLWFQEKWSPAFEIVKVGTDPAYSTMSTELEIAIMKGLSIDELPPKLMWITGEQLRLYERLFFDIEGVVTIASWMEDKVFTPRTRRRKSNVVAMLKAYYSDGPCDPTGRTSTDDNNFVMAGILNNARMKQAAEYLLGDSDIPLELFAGCMETALRDIEESRKKSLEDRGGTAITDQNLLDQLKAVTQRRTPDEVRALLESSPTGIEFSSDMDYIRNKILEEKELEHKK